MSIERVNPPSLAAPIRFLARRRSRPAGGWCSWPGRPRWTLRRVVVGATVAEQFEQALGNLLTALARRRAGPRAPDQPDRLRG